MQKRNPGMTAMDRLRAKINVTAPDECWRWVGYLDRDGYGKFWDGEHVTFAHRVSYRLHIGPIPHGQQIDHLCRNRACVNPVHLEAVTPRENNARSNSPAARHAQASECPHGHPYDEDNTYVRPDGKGRGCLTCRRVSDARRRR